MTRSLFLFLIFLLSQRILGLCQTNVGGTLTQNTVWSLAGSPYTLTSAVGVLPGITLTIQPGVQINGNFDIVIRGGTLLMAGADGQRITVQGSRILFKSSDLSNSSIAYVDFNQAGVQLGDESEFNQDNVKNSNTLTVKNVAFSTNSFGRTKGYQTTAKLRFEQSSINNSVIIGYYPRSEPIELDAVTINNTTITSDSYNLGIKVTNSIVNNTSFLMGCCGANFDIFDSEINNSSFKESNIGGFIKLSKVNLNETYFSLPSVQLSMADCTAKVSSSIPVFVSMGNGEIKNSSIEGSSSTTLFKVTGKSGYNAGGSVVFQKMNFNLFGTAIEILNFAQLTISQNNFLSASSYNLKNNSAKDITANGNYWGTTDEQTIKDKIYDIYDNINSGLVNYTGFLQSKVLASQTITFTSLATKTFGDAPFALSGISSSGLALTYTSSNAAVATVTGNMVTIVGAGATTITAKQEGNTNYDPAVDVAQSLTVTKAPQTITFAALANKTFGDVPFTLSGTSSSGLAVAYISGNTAVATVSGNTVTIVGAGSANITAKQAGNNNYNAAVDVVQSLTVNKASQTITFSALSGKTFGDAPFTLPGTSSSGLAVAYISSNTAVATVSGNTVTIVGAGSANITAKQAGNNNYNAAVDVVQSLTVNKASQTITFSALSGKTFGDAPFTLPGTSSSGLAVAYISSNTAVATVSGNTVTIVGAGSANITAKQAGNNNYNPAVDVVQSLTVNKASQTITFSALSGKAFGDAPFTLSGTSSSGLSLTYTSNNTSVATVSGNTVTIVGSGAANITAKQAGDNNYNAAVDVVQSLTVNKASQTVTFTTLSNKTFGDAPFTLSGTASSGLPLTYASSNAAVATVSGNTVTIVGAGVTSITASQAGNSNYNAGETSRQLTVNKALQTITFTTLSNKTFGDAPFTLSGSSSSGLPLTFTSGNTAVATVSGNTVTIVGGGTTTITASQAGNNNYNPAEVPQQFTVNKASQTITFAALVSKTFGDAPLSLSGSSSSGLTLTYSSSNTGVATVSGTTVTIVGAGTATITAKQTGNNNYNAALDVSRQLVVNKAAQNITFAPLQGKTFGDVPFTLSASASSALLITYTSSDPSVAAIDANTVTILRAGTTTITARQAGNDNYLATADKQQVLTINKALPSLSWPTPADIDFGTSLNSTQLNATSSVSGSFTYVPTAGTKLATGSGQQLSVTFTPADAVNYSSATKQVFINVNKITPAITWSSPADIVYGTLLDATQLNATCSVNGTFSYTPATGTKLSAGVNQLSVTFTPTDAVNYSSATKVVAINVAKATPAVNWLNPADIVYGTALSSTQLNATSLEGGTFTYAPAAGEILNAGSGQLLSVTFSPSDAVNFTSVTKQAVLNVSKATPAISWPTPADLVYGTPLSSTQLNATSLVAGTYSYTPAIGATLNAGNGQQLLVTFVPTDAANYLSTTASVFINVTRAQLQISFAAIADKTLGNAPFILTASSNSTLPVIFSSNSDKVSIANNQVTLVKAGRVSVTASQLGNENYNVASSVTQSFCIKPTKPTVTISNLNTPTPLLTSNASAGNQWYVDGAAIAGATNATFSATKSGIYKVQVTVDDCTGEFSAEQPLVVTGLEASNHSIDLYPNPVTDVVTIYFGDLAGHKQVTIFALAGQELVSSKTESGSIAIDVSNLSAGMYIAKVIAGGAVQTKKFKKQ